MIRWEGLPTHFHWPPVYYTSQVAHDNPHIDLHLFVGLFLPLSYFLFFHFISVCLCVYADWEGCKCSAEGSWSVVCHVWSQQCQADCSRDAQLPWDSGLLHQRGDGGCWCSKNVCFFLKYQVRIGDACFHHSKPAVFRICMTNHI